MANLEMITTAASYTHGVKIISIRNVTAQTRTELRASIEQAAPQMLAELAELADTATGWAYDRIRIAAGYRVKGHFQRVMEIPFEVGA